jgi:CRISPR-associated protein Csc1
MAMTIYRADLTLMEHTYFASREIGTLYESEPLIGNYALTYALGLCTAPYGWNGPPRYKQDLEPLNARGIYVTPATFQEGKLRYAFSQFNAQSDSYYFRFDQNAIATDPVKKTRAANFPQNGKLRMLGLDSQAVFYLLSENEPLPRLPSYIRLGKFNSKARIVWSRLRLRSERPHERTAEMAFFLNAVDLSPEHLAHLRAFSVYNIYPAPLLRQCRLQGAFWQAISQDGSEVLLPTGMKYGIESLPA